MKNALHFTVGLVNGQHLRILAGDAKTRTWALSVQARISVVTRTITDELVGKTIVHRRSATDGPHVVALEEIRHRFLELLVERWPRARFVVTEEADQTPVVSDLATSAEAMYGVLTMLAGQATPAETKT